MHVLSQAICRLSLLRLCILQDDSSGLMRHPKQGSTRVPVHDDSTYLVVTRLTREDTMLVTAYKP